VALDLLAQGDLGIDFRRIKEAFGRRSREQQPSFWIAVDELPRSEGHVFYGKLNQLLRAAGFPTNFIMDLCRFRQRRRAERIAPW